MFGKIFLWAAAAVVAGLMLPSQAMAQYDAHTATDLNLRVGPGTEYGVIDVIPGGYPVDVLGCLDAYEWCDIEWDGLRGWVFARYLVQPGTTVYLPQYAPRIGVPIISFSFGTYHDRYYRDRPWYRERYGRWRGRDYRRGNRDTRVIREERTREEQTEQRRETRQRQKQETEQRQQQRQQADQPRLGKRTQQRQPETEQRQQADQPRLGKRTQQRQPERQGQRNQKRNSDDEEERRPRLGQ